MKREGASYTSSLFDRIFIFFSKKEFYQLYGIMERVMERVRLKEVERWMRN